MFSSILGLYSLPVAHTSCNNQKRLQIQSNVPWSCKNAPHWKSLEVRFLHSQNLLKNLFKIADNRDPPWLFWFNKNRKLYYFKSSIEVSSSPSLEITLWLLTMGKKWLKGTLWPSSNTQKFPYKNKTHLFLSSWKGSSDQITKQKE